MTHRVGASAAWRFAALASLLAAVWIAAHHPLSPPIALVALAAWIVAASRWQGLWLFIIPAALPAANSSPWSGWLIFDEFDLLVLGALATGFARLAQDCGTGGSALLPSKRTAWRPSLWVVLAVLLGALGLLQLVGALAGSWTFDWFQGFADPLNAWRVFKGELYALLMLPMLQREIRRSSAAVIERLGRGMLVGTGVVALAILWERAAYPGLLDFSAPYRTTALFWEMHVGGAALDVYLAMAAPFVAWALWSARSWTQWIAAALVALLAGYAVLTTFSRGVYLGVAGPLLLLVLWLRAPRWRRAWRAPHARVIGAVVLSLCLLAETVAVLTGGSFMLTRLKAGERDLGERLVHWRHGIELLHGPLDWMRGIGLGRLPSRYATLATGEFSGELKFSPQSTEQPFVILSGPRTSRRLAGSFGLTQRVSLRPDGQRRASLRVRTPDTVQLALTVCEMHLLYPRRCQWAVVRIPPNLTSWQEIDVPLQGPPLTRGAWFAPRLGVFEVSVLTVGGAVDLERIRLAVPGGADLLHNGDFKDGRAHWFPLAQDYFLPWHIDNQWLELLIERGLAGALLVLILIGCALWRLRGSPRSGLSFGPFLAASLCGTQIVGLVSSVMDTPRVAFMLFLLSFLALQLTEAHSASQPLPLRSRD